MWDSAASQDCLGCDAAGKLLNLSPRWFEGSAALRPAASAAGGGGSGGSGGGSSPGDVAAERFPIAPALRDRLEVSQLRGPFMGLCVQATTVLRAAMPEISSTWRRLVAGEL
eukprot:SAG22_NODE_3749_length_1546_cov_2.126469_2_plen_112_part_00